VRTELNFLTQFYVEQKKQAVTPSKADSVLLKQIAICLKKVKKSPNTSAVCRLPSADTNFVVSQGVKTSVRIRNLNQPSLQKLISAESVKKISTDSFACNLLIAAVHGLQSFPTPCPGPLPVRHPAEFLTCFVPFHHSKGREATTTAPENSLFVLTCEMSFSLSASYKFESEARLLADNFLALRSTRRLE
jgi:hypothetical protein